MAEHAAQIRDDFPDYHARPVGSWGDPNAQLLIVGLAPGLHGAFRTGKAFVGDASGQLLFEALYAVGFASAKDAADARLINTRITNAVKCLPPQNAPTGAEVSQCREWLIPELENHAPVKARKKRVILTLGGVAHRAVVRALQLDTRPEFAHANSFDVRPNLRLIASFHPSRLNINTGRINSDMMAAVLAQARDFLISAKQ